VANRQPPQIIHVTETSIELSPLDWHLATTAETFLLPSSSATTAVLLSPIAPLSRCCCCCWKVLLAILAYEMEGTPTSSSSSAAPAGSDVAKSNDGATKKQHHKHHKRHNKTTTTTGKKRSRSTSNDTRCSKRQKSLHRSSNSQPTRPKPLDRTASEPSTSTSTSTTNTTSAADGTEQPRAPRKVYDSSSTLVLQRLVDNKYFDTRYHAASSTETTTSTTDIDWARSSRIRDYRLCKPHGSKARRCWTSVAIVDASLWLSVCDSAALLRATVTVVRVQRYAHVY
jgi:hypothetical protein